MAKEFCKRIIYPEVGRMMIVKNINTPTLANLTGISYPTMRRKLTGEVEMLLDEAILIRNALQPGMHLEELFSRRPMEQGEATPMIDAMQRREIYQAAIDAWGEDNQLTVAMEEMAELTKEICKWQRRDGNTDHICEEIADVRICLEQLEMIFYCENRVCGIVQEKAARLTERIKKAQSENCG